MLSVAVAGLTAATLGIRSLWRADEGRDVRELAAAVGASLPFEARLSGFQPASGDVRRSAASGAAALSPDVRIAIAKIEKRAAADPSESSLAAAGVASLIGGDVDRAIATLEEVTAVGGSAAAWSDLGAAYLVKAQRAPERRIEYVARANEAAAASLRIRDSNEARVNRALAVDALTPYLGAAAEAARERWDARKGELAARLAASDRAFVQDTVARFPDAALDFFDRELLVAWGRAARDHDGPRAGGLLEQARLMADCIFATTGDPMQREAVAAIRSAPRRVAQAHVDYAEAISRYDANRYDAAAALFASASAPFQAARDPYRHWAALQTAIILFQQRDVAAADRRLAEVEAEARRGGYTVLLGRTLWVRGLLDTKVHRLTEALDAFRAAESCFDRAKLAEAKVSLASDIADGLRVLGEHQDSWQYIGKTLEGLSQVRKPIRRYLFLYNASLFSSNQGLMEVALLFQNAALDEARRAGAGPAVEALTVRASLLARRGEKAAALRDVDEARRTLAAVPDGAAKRYHQAQLDLAFVDLGEPQDVGRHAADLQQAVDFFAVAEPALVPQLYLGLGRAYLAARATDRAEAAFDRGIAEIERQQAHVADAAFRMSYFDESWDLYPAMIALQDGVRHAPDAAFAYAERARARSLLADERTVTLGELQRALPRSAVLLYYATLPDRILIWTITPGGYDVRDSRIDRARLRWLIARYRTSLIDRQPQPSAAGEALFDLLVRPVLPQLAGGPSLVIVADGELQQVPFAALRDRRSGTYLVERHRIVEAPSATFFARRLAHARELDTRGMRSALLVGNPAVDRVALRGAEREVLAAAAWYPERTLLTGAEATKERFVRSIAAFDVVHFGGHAFANAQYPTLSRLVFSGPDGSEDPLFAYEIAGLRLPRTRLVVLAACSTAAGAVSRGEGIVSVARPFLSAGVPTVVAAQWDVDDRATARFFETFHRALHESTDPADALRTAQLSLLRGGDPYFAAPASWAPFVALGTITH